METRADNPTSLRTVDRAFEILTAVAAQDEGITLAELSARAGVPRPTGLRIARALVGWGALERTDMGYRLGPRMFELGLRADGHTRLRDLALPIMSEMYAWSHGTVHLAVLEGSSTLIVEKIAGPRSVTLSSRVGGRGPLHCTGLGKALLAHSPEATFDEVVGSRLVRRTSRTVTRVSGLRGQLAEVRRTGLAFESGESTEGVACVAAAVFGPDRSVVAALSIAGTATEVRPERLGPAVRDAAGLLTRLVSRRP